MLRFLGMILILGLFLVPTMAQEEELTGYEIALQRIEEARVSGATYLYLGELSLTQLPPEIGNLINLQYLTLSVNELAELPPEIGNLSNLIYLDASSNPLGNLPPEFGQLTSLKELWAQSTELTSLPPEFAQLKNLEILHLDGNEFSSFPSEIAQLSALRELYLENNLLSNLPFELANLPALCRLHLRSNQFEIAPAVLLAIDWNKVDEELGSCYFDLDYNPLSELPVRATLGSSTILEYLRNEAWWHLQRLIAGGAGFVALLSSIVLGLRWRSRRGYEKKKKG